MLPGAGLLPVMASIVSPGSSTGGRIWKATLTALGCAWVLCAFVLAAAAAADSEVLLVLSLPGALCGQAGKLGSPDAPVLDAGVDC